MKFRIEARKPFVKQAKRLAKKYKSFKDDYAILLDELRANPLAGTDLGDGLRKIRMAISDKNKGKSGGARVITYHYKVDEENGVLWLILVYDKSELENVPKENIMRILEKVKNEIWPQ